MRYENKKEILNRGITVAELIEALQSQSPTARVVFAADYGDISHTVQALVVKDVEAVDFNDISETGYSQSGLCIFNSSGELDSDDEIYAAKQDEEQVVVLNLH